MNAAPDTAGRPDFTRLPDLASRAVAGSVVWANDEFFAEKENLILPSESVFDPDEFGHKGKVYDGWETRRRREPGEDSAIVRLGVPGLVRGVTVDTAWFKGNYPPEASVDGVWVDGYPTVEELLEADWQPLVPRSAIQGDTKNDFAVAEPRPVTHVRLRIHPDGGVARLRVHGVPTPDPGFLRGTVDLAALENGGSVVDCSNLFYSSPTNIISPGRSRLMGEGWENARRRDEGNDHVTVRLAGEGVIEHIELDTSYYVGNAPGWATIHGIVDEADLDRRDAWVELLPRTRLLPDCRHRFMVGLEGGTAADGADAEAPAADTAFRYLRVDVIPDGGIARLRVNGRLTAAALGAMEEAVRGGRG